MKLIRTILFLSATLSLVSCHKDPDNPVDPGTEEPEVVSKLVFAQGQDQKLQFSVNLETYDILFNCTDAWSASVKPDGIEGTWISIYPHSGVPGDGKFTVTVKANETLEEHDGFIVIYYSDKTDTVTVHQAALDKLRYTYTGSELLEPLAATYDVFKEKDLMPDAITINGDKLEKGYYYEAMCLLLPDLAKGTDEWKTKTYTLKKCRASDSPGMYETYAPDEVDLERVLWINEKQCDYALQHGRVFANYCTLDNSFFSLTRSLVVCSRILSAYKKDGVLPSKVSSWYSDFLRNMDYYTSSISDKYCDINDPVVVKARDEAIAGKTTTMEKAVALFEYARDKWEWLDYSNTHKGALNVITGHEGNCCDLSHGLIAIARSAGIPARYVHGPSTYYPSGNIYGHVWAELYVDGKWYVCDPSNNSCRFDVPLWILEKSTIRGKYRDLPF